MPAERAARPNGRRTGNSSADSALGEIRTRALAAFVAVAIRGLTARGIQFGGTLFIARLLGQQQFGLLAFGLSVLTLSAFFTDFGLGASLIRRTGPVEHADLEALLFLQLAAALLFVLAATTMIPLFGEGAAITATMLVGLPLLAVRAPIVVIMERSLNFRRVAIAEVLDALTLYGGASIAVGLGLGIWGVAFAAAVRPALGTCVLCLGKMRGLRPRFDRERIRILLRFGGRYQAAGLLNLARDQGLNMLLALSAGTAVLGLWNVAYRILQVPFLLFTSLWRVSFPTMARMVREQHDVRDVLELGAETIATATALMLVPLMLSGPGLIDFVLGRSWERAGDVLLPSCAGLLISGPVSVCAVGVLYATGDASTSIRAIASETVVWWAVALSLLGLMGPRAIGLGWLMAALVEATIFGRAVKRAVNADLLAHVLPIGISAGAIGFGATLVVRVGHLDGLDVCGVVVLCEGIVLIAAALLHPRVMRELRSAVVVRRVRGTPAGVAA